MKKCLGIVSWLTAMAMTWGCGGSNESGKSESQANVGVIHVSTYAYASCAVTSDGRIYCWGDNSYLTLQQSDRKDRGSPVPISLVPGSANAVATAVGFTQICALLADATVQCWGSNTGEPAVVVGITGAQAISSGHQHTCALLTGGKVKCWGDSTWGQQGQTNADGTIALSSTVEALKAGRYHTVVLLSDGTVWYWGQNAFGFQGTDTLAKSLEPIQIPGVANAVAITTEENFACALIADGSVQCWGTSSDGVLGTSGITSSTTAVQVAKIPGATEIGSSGFAVYVLKGDGTVMTWGSNKVFGVLGDESLASGAAPATIPSLEGVTSVDGGSYHACALASGHVWCWGYPDHGQVGNGSIGTGIVWSPYEVVVP